jgi:hypothetical protein
VASHAAVPFTRVDDDEVERERESEQESERASERDQSTCIQHVCVHHRFRVQGLHKP